MKNVGNKDRLLRLFAAVPLILCSVMAPLPLAARVLAFAIPGVYLLLTALVGVCLGYKMMGKNTCAVRGLSRP